MYCGVVDLWLRRPRLTILRLRGTRASLWDRRFAYKLESHRLDVVKQTRFTCELPSRRIQNSAQ